MFYLAEWWNGTHLRCAEKLTCRLAGSTPVSASMKPYTKNYLTFFGYDEGGFIPCSICQSEAVDLHHIEPKSKFGSKRKGEQDKVENLIALCRFHHEQAHANILTKLYLKELQKEIINEKSK